MQMHGDAGLGSAGILGTHQGPYSNGANINTLVSPHGGEMHWMHQLCCHSSHFLGLFQLARQARSSASTEPPFGIGWWKCSEGHARSIRQHCHAQGKREIMRTLTDSELDAVAGGAILAHHPGPSPSCPHGKSCGCPT